MGEVDDNESIRAIHRGLDLGVNFFDTADVYGAGHSERVLAQALAWLWARSEKNIPIPGFKTIAQVEDNCGVNSAFKSVHPRIPPRNAADTVLTPPTAACLRGKGSLDSAKRPLRRRKTSNSYFG